MINNFLEGHTVYLRLPEKEDVFIHGWHQWYNDYNVTRYNSHGVFPVSKDQEWEIIQNEMKNNKSILLAIWEKKENTLIGNICLQDIDLINRRARLAVTLGAAAPPTSIVEAYGLMTHHAFERVNLNRIFDSTHEKLINFVKSIQIFGYQVEGRGNEHYFKDGKYSDLIYFGLTRSVYYKKLKERKNRVLFENVSDLVGSIRDEMKT